MQKAESALAASSTCCRTLKEIQYEALSLDKSKKFTLDASAPAFNFETGKSRFVAIQLPEGKKLNVAATTHLYGGFYINTSYVFYPVAIILNSNHQVIGTVKDFTPRFRAGLSSAGGWSGKFPLDTKATGARYLILFTDGGVTPQTLSLTGGTMSTVTYGKTTALYTGGNKQYSVPFGKEGQLTIEFQSE